MKQRSGSYRGHAVLFIILFLAVRLVLVGWAGFLFENIEDYRIAAGAEVLLAYCSAAAHAGRAGIEPLLIYPPDHCTLGAPAAVALLAPLRWALGPLTPGQFKLELIAINLAAGLCWLRLFMLLHAGRGAIWFILLYSLLPPALLEMSLMSPGSHGETPLFLAVFYLLLHRAIRTDRAPGPAAGLALGLWCGVSVLFLPSLLLLPLIAGIALAGRRRWRSLAAVVSGSLPALLVVALLVHRFLPLAWSGRDYISFNLAGIAKLLTFVTRDLPAVVGNQAWSGLALAAIVLAATRWLTGTRHDHRTFLGLLLLYPLGWLTVYCWTTIEFDVGLRPSHTYKYFASLIPFFYFFICARLRPGRPFAVMILAGLLAVSAGLLVREYRVAAPFTDGPYRVWEQGYRQYGELAVQLIDTADALRLLPLIAEPGRRAVFLDAVGEFTAIRAHREARHYAPALARPDHTAFYAGFVRGAYRENTLPELLWEQRIAATVLSQ